MPASMIAFLIGLIYFAVTTTVEDGKVHDMTVASIEKTFPYKMYQSRDELLLYKRLDTKLGAGTYVLHTCNAGYLTSLRYNFHSTNATDVSKCEMCDYDYDVESH